MWSESLTIYDPVEDINKRLDEEQIKQSYMTYCLKMLTMDIDDLIDAEHLNYEEFKKRLLTERG